MPHAHSISQSPTRNQYAITQLQTPRAGESAMGAYPSKALAVLRDVATRMEAWGREEKFGSVVLPQLGAAPDERVSEEVRGRVCGRRRGAGRGKAEARACDRARVPLRTAARACSRAYAHVDTVAVTQSRTRTRARAALRLRCSHGEQSGGGRHPGAVTQARAHTHRPPTHPPTHTRARSSAALLLSWRTTWGRPPSWSTRGAATWLSSCHVAGV